MSNEQILLWVLGLISAFFGIRWQASSRENEHLKQKLSEKKEKLYTEFVGFYMTLLSNPEKKDKAISEMKKLNEKMILIASNKVLLTYGDLMQTLYLTEAKHPTLLLRLIGELFIAMREDLGHRDWLNSVFWGDAIRPWLNDAYKFLPQGKNGIRRVYSRYTDPVNHEPESKSNKTQNNNN